MRCLAVVLAIAAGIVAIGCGPSLRRVHRSQVYFERCYAADLDETVPVAERHACWQQWMAHYQVGQPPDRIDYVRERILRLDPERSAILAMAGGESGDLTTPEIASEAGTVTAAMTGGEPIAEPVSVTTSTEPIAAEIPVAPVPDRPAPETVTPVPDPPAPPPPDIPPASERRWQRHPPIPRTDAPHCAEACRPGWESCLAQCADADPAACRRACRLQHRTCARACY